MQLTLSQTDAMRNQRRLHEKPMANYIADYQKRDKIVAKRERALEGAIKHNVSPEHLAVLAEKVRQSKLQAFRARKQNACNQVPSQRAVEKWLAMTPDEIIQMVRKKCEQLRAATTPESELRAVSDAPDA